MIRCGLISKYLEIKSPSLLIYRSHFKRFVSLTHTCTLSHGQVLLHTNQCKTIALKLLSCLFNCHFLLGRHAITNMLYFVGYAGTNNVVHFFILVETQFALYRSPPPHTLWFQFWSYFGIPSLLLFFASCLSKVAVNPITSAPFSPQPISPENQVLLLIPYPLLWSSQDDPGVITINVVAVLPSPTSLLNNRTLCSTFPFFARLRTAHHHLREICLQ